ncbi:unnamed protein product [Aphanomyces euteiches]|uniref:Amino acid permease/ SLC12A domain-containing protein n=1 Tax=Aphanomyces euteiches TaxID=100861 RepID=A0A6G0WT71_9STRA|nr:hypothetical protein Ae201684_012046 [Aphanomyces euteiches]KAH9133119.1 hypothetical protein AeRB84_020731 [Aphanomyces euteiches]
MLSNKSSSAFEVWALGIALVIGGQTVAWNFGFVAGTISYGLAVFVIGMTHLCMVFSIAEVASVVAFHGGVYGLARCTLGFYFGYMAGCCELLEYALLVTASSIALAALIVDQWPSVRPYTPVICLVNQTVSYTVFLLGRRILWRYTVVLVIVTFMILFLYFFSAWSLANVKEYGGGMDYAFVGGLPAFIAVLPHATWMFSGIEALNTLGNDLTDPKRLTPKGQVTAMCTLLATACCTFITTISLPPGVEALPAVYGSMTGGFSAAFNLPEASSRLFSLPATIASNATLILPANNILVAMAESKLLPIKLAECHPRYGTNVNAPAALMVVTTGFCFVLFYAGSHVGWFYNVCLVCCLLSYIAQCAGFVYLRRHHKHMTRLYVSPVGIPGAVFAMAVFGTSIVSVLFFQGDGYSAIVATATTLVLLTAYYHVFAKSHQTLSDDERALFFAHVAKFNARSKNPNSKTGSASWFSIGLFPSTTKIHRKIRVKPSNSLPS